ncbi:hypothetical protein ABW19_dt0206702 [Dactylella cylindrospora]|nr:hypothetical protein ABW19_dt0206702 [Dactylella cylindrospora]
MTTDNTTECPPSYTEATEFAPGYARDYPNDVKEEISSSSEEVSTSLPERSGFAFYSIDFAKHSYHMDHLIKDATDTPRYYVDNKFLVAALRGGKPDIIIYEGIDVSGPIVFASRSNFFGNKHEYCYGDPKTSDVFGEYRLKNLVSLTCTWSPPDSSKKYTWQRIYGKESEALGGRKTSLLTMKLTDDETGEILATYLNDGFKTWRKAGTYQIKANPDVGDEWEKYVLCTGCVLTEKERRVRRWAYYSGGACGC